MRNLKWSVMLIGLLILSLVLAACTSTGGETTTSPEATTAVEGVAPVEEPGGEEPAEDMAEGERKIATFIWTQEFDSLSPFYTNMWFSQVTRQLWNVWAWDYDENLNIIPVLVTEMPTEENGGISADGRTLTFKLRDDIVWSDGTPITSEDFVFTFEMALDPANTVNSTYPYDQYESIDAPDPQTVVLTSAEPFAPWEATLWHSLLPAHVLRPVFEADGTLDNAEWNLAPTVGAGPYRFEEWESGSYARFVKNENWWGPEPNIDEIFFRFVPDDASQVAALQNGEGDLGTFISWSDFPTLESAGLDMRTVSSGFREGWFFFLGDEQIPGHPALQDVRVRQAIAQAFDREALIQDVLLGLTKPVETLWDDTPFVSPDIVPWQYNPEAANALLDEAGWVDSNGDGVRDKDGVELVLVHGSTTREIRQDTQAVAQQQLAEIGIGLELQSLDSTVFFASYGENGPTYTGEIDIQQWSDVTSFPDPDISYWLCSEIPTDEYPDGTNNFRICDEELDELFRLQATQTIPEERIATFHQISKLMHDQVYWFGVWDDPDGWAIGPRLQNVRLSGVTPFFAITEWDISE
jgi:peptide/nickel transport system substrate-binding protein